jgi:hypothetical protein
LIGNSLIPTERELTFGLAESRLSLHAQKARDPTFIRKNYLPKLAVNSAA